MYRFRTVSPVNTYIVCSLEIKIFQWKQLINFLNNPFVSSIEKGPFILFLLLCNFSPDDVQSIVSGKLALRYGGPNVEAMKSIAQASKKRSLANFQKVKMFITARIRRMGKSTILSLSVHTSRGGGVPRPGLDGWGGGGTPARSEWWGEYPGQVWMVGGGYPSQVLMGGPPARSGWWGCTQNTLPPGLDVGVPPARSGW